MHATFPLTGNLITLSIKYCLAKILNWPFLILTRIPPARKDTLMTIFSTVIAFPQNMFSWNELGARLEVLKNTKNYQNLPSLFGIFVFLSSQVFKFWFLNHYDEMYEGSQVSKVTLLVEIGTDQHLWLLGMYRAAS